MLIFDEILIDLGINLFCSVDSFNFKKNIHSLESQFPSFFMSDVVICKTVAFDDTYGLVILGFHEHDLEEYLRVPRWAPCADYTGLGGLLWT